MSKIIAPTVGRVVWYRESPDQESPWAAIVTDIHTDRLVDLFVMPADGAAAQPLTSVTLVQPNDEVPGGCFCTWMPYQTRKAFGSESGERAAGEEVV